MADLTVQMLVSNGFSAVGSWVVDASSVGGARLDGTAPRGPGVYAHAVDGVVQYVGSAHRGLRRRLQHYQTTIRLRTAYRVRTAILEALASGQAVETVAIVPAPGSLTWNAMPIDLVLGLEEGLIRTYRPNWNRRGLGKTRIALVSEEA